MTRLQRESFGGLHATFNPTFSLPTYLNVRIKLKPESKNFWTYMVFVYPVHIFVVFQTCNLVDAAQSILEPEGCRPRHGHRPLEGVGGRPVRPQLVGHGGEEAALGEDRSRTDVVEQEAAGAVPATIKSSARLRDPESRNLGVALFVRLCRLQ